MIDLVWLTWVACSIAVLIVGVPYVYSPQVLPDIAVRLFQYGKTNNPAQKSFSALKKIEVPKRWFAHFYAFAVVYHTFLTWTAYQVYVVGEAPSWLAIKLLDFMTGNSSRPITVSPEGVFITMTLLLMQIYARCYECFFISIYSESKMNVFHYLMGYIFYFNISLSVLKEAPGFTTASTQFAVSISSVFRWKHIIGTVIFISAFAIQRCSTFRLANLRKNSKGELVTRKHIMPYGGWFELVSCPHYTAEIIMYLALAIVLGGCNISWWLTCLWVISNQTITGLMFHQWYQKNFRDYPPSRKAVIPYIL